VLTCKTLEELAALGETLHLALGVFDGVHIGHQAVIARAVQAAEKEGGLAGLLTFDPHPIRVIAPSKAPAALLASLDHKAAIVGALGGSLFIPLRFDPEFARMEASQFIDQLTSAAPIRTLAVGEDWRFGHNRSGDVGFLKHQAASKGFQLEAVPPVMFGGDRISSTRIRQAIHDGNLAEAGRMLGRPYSICGVVQRGDQIGRTIGFPTANLATDEIQLPPGGVWAVRVSIEGGAPLLGVANIGSRPTVGGVKLLLEVHLLAFDGDLYGRNIEVWFEKHLRAESRFPTLEALRAQIAIDVEEAGRILQNEGLDEGLSS
jgi:riboflavin kinase/FMN adenylyltransferase